MQQRSCFIVGAGSFDGMRIQPVPGDLVVAADGGYAHLEGLGILPDALVGDFDSLAGIPAKQQNLIRFSPIKDDTDMALAAAYGREQGCTRFFLYGGLGGERLDHTFANVQLLTGLSKAGMEAYLIGQGNILTVLTGERIRFGGSASGMVSVFALGDQASQICEQGLKYTVRDFTMTNDKTRGVSNEFLGEESSIEVGEGCLLVLWDEENGLPAHRERLGRE